MYFYKFHQIFNIFYVIKRFEQGQLRANIDSKKLKVNLSKTKLR